MSARPNNVASFASWVGSCTPAFRSFMTPFSEFLLSLGGYAVTLVFLPLIFSVIFGWYWMLSFVAVRVSSSTKM